jgi:hypothetical protein
MMQASLAEAESLVLKAAVGVGLEPGLASLSARATRWLCQYGLPGTRLVVRALSNGLERRSVGVKWTGERKLCAVTENQMVSVLYAGAVVIDHRSLARAPMTVTSPDEPLLLLAMVAHAIGDGSAKVTWPDSSGNRQGLQVDNDGFTFLGEGYCPLHRSGALDLCLTCDWNPPAVTGSVLWNDAALVHRQKSVYKNGVEIEQTELLFLHQWGAKTLIPDSDISREKGAGAGRIDTD